MNCRENFERATLTKGSRPLDAECCIILCLNVYVLCLSVYVCETTTLSETTTTVQTTTEPTTTEQPTTTTGNDDELQLQLLNLAHN